MLVGGAGRAQAFALIMSALLTALVWDVLVVSLVAPTWLTSADAHMVGLKVAPCRGGAARVAVLVPLSTVVGEPRPPEPWPAGT